MSSDASGMQAVHYEMASFHNRSDPGIDRGASLVGEGRKPLPYSPLVLLSRRRPGLP